MLFVMYSLHKDGHGNSWLQLSEHWSVYVLLCPVTKQPATLLTIYTLWTIFRLSMMLMELVLRNSVCIQLNVLSSLSFFCRSIICKRLIAIKFFAYPPIKSSSDLKKVSGLSRSKQTGSGRASAEVIKLLTSTKFCSLAVAVVTTSKMT